jgi:murein DD-endopeptidase MepM/ murein hydrolase activator NlpD
MARPALIALSVSLALAPAALAQTGGVVAAPGVKTVDGAGGPSGQTGGARAGDRALRRQIARRRTLRRLRAAPVLGAFELGSAKLFQYGGNTQVSFRVDGRAKRVKVRLYVVPAGGGKAVATLELGELSTGTTHTATLDPDGLAPGRYRLRISARDRRGRAARHAKAVAAVAEFALYGHRFPLVGSFSYGGEGSRFGAPRPGHTHQGQDLSAAEGTPVVAPHGGTVEAVQYQAQGAGHYVVLDGNDGRDYVFMHLRTDSILVREGERVRTGQQLAEVGNTGSSSGAHLHFEIWEGGGGWFDGGQPVDPLPYLKSWDRYS